MAVLLPADQAIKRLKENEAERFDIFVNAPNGEVSYMTNGGKPVETLPHYMKRIGKRYLTVVLQGEWQSGMQLGMNDVVEGQDSKMWIATGSFTTSDSIAQDIAAGNLSIWNASIADGIIWGPSIMGGVSRPAADKLSELVSVTDLGARGDGETDNAQAFYYADLHAAGSGNPIYVPAGNFHIKGYIPSAKYFGPGTVKIFAGAFNGVELTVDPNTTNQEEVCLIEDGEVFPLDLGTPQRIRNSSADCGGRRAYNFVVGPGAGAKLQFAGRYNFAVGFEAMATNETGDRNTALGQGALRDCRHPYGTEAIGADAAMCSDFSNRNSFFGANAGKWSGCADPVGKKHDLFLAGSPHLAALEEVWPDYRSIIGPVAGPSLLVATQDSDNRGNMGMGRDSLLWNISGTNNTAFGYHALFGWNASNCVAIGANALLYGLAAENCVAVGVHALRHNITGAFNIGIGYASAGLNVHGNRNVAIGHRALNNLSGDSTTQSIAQPNATMNVVIGYSAMRLPTKSIANTVIGSFCAEEFAGQESVIFGSQAARYAAGDSMVAVGTLSAEHAGGNHVIAIGAQAARHAKGNFNVAIGGFALGMQTSGVTGDRNTCMGYRALGNITTGTMNSGLGYQAGMNMQDGTPATTVAGSTCIGAFSTVSGNNQIQLGNTGATTYAYGAVQQRSDARDKTDIHNTNLGLQFILALRPVAFRWAYRENEGIQGTRYHQGLIAQEVKAIADGLGEDFAGYQDHTINGGCDVLSLGYEEFIAPMVKAMQEMHTIIIEQGERINALEQRAV